MVRHAFRPASISLMTVTGSSIGGLWAAPSSWSRSSCSPGSGELVQAPIVKRDLIMVQGIVVFVAVACVEHLVVDLLYGVVDPRIRARDERSAPTR